MEEQMNILQLLKDLTEVQVMSAKVDAQLAIREGQNQITEVIQNTIDKYKSVKKDKQETIEEYRKDLNEVNKVYDFLIKEALERKAELEAQEQKNILQLKENKMFIKEARRVYKNQVKDMKDQIIKLTKQGNLEQAQELMKKLQEYENNNTLKKYEEIGKTLKQQKNDLRTAINKCEMHYDKLKAGRRDVMTEITTEKDDKLAVIPKQNVFQKMMGAVLSWFNSSKYTVKASMEPLKSKVAKIKEEEIPKIMKRAEDTRQQFYESVIEPVKDKVEQKRESITVGISKVENTFKSVIDRGSKMKANFIKQAQERIEKKRADISQKMQKLNSDFANRNETEGNIEK